MQFGERDGMGTVMFVFLFIKKQKNELVSKGEFLCWKFTAFLIKQIDN